MLPAHQPANVRKEEASVRIVWISIRVRILVVLSVVTYPHPETVLPRQRVHVKQEDAHPPVRLERSMGPQSVRAHCHSLARRVDQPERCGGKYDLL